MGKSVEIPDKLSQGCLLRREMETGRLRLAFEDRVTILAGGRAQVA
jgi:hypothetical protein